MQRPNGIASAVGRRPVRSLLLVRRAAFLYDDAQASECAAQVRPPTFGKAVAQATGRYQTHAQPRIALGDLGGGFDAGQPTTYDDYLAGVRARLRCQTAAERWRSNSLSPGLPTARACSRTPATLSLSVWLPKV